MSIVGKWRNEYGSTLDIRSHGESGCLVGVYASHTGETGTYRVSGWSPRNIDGAGNQPVSLCVSWRPLGGTEETAGWHSVSVMSGVLFLDAFGAVPRIRVLHGLVISTSGETTQRPGVYTETLSFEKSPEQPGTPHDLNNGVDDFSDREAARVTLTGDGLGAQLASISLRTDVHGRVAGTASCLEQAVATHGFVDPKPRGKLQSVALSMLAGPSGERCVSLGGFIDLQTGTARLQRFDAEAVVYPSRYTAVAIGQEAFTIALDE